MLIIGYGNPLRGDDAVGFLAAERLMDWFERQGLVGGLRLRSSTLQRSSSLQAPIHPRLEVIARQCLTIELAADLARHRHALFIDAGLQGPPGVICCRRIRPANQVGPLPHALTPPELLGWCSLLYGLAPKSALITIGGLSFDYAEGRLSPPVEAALGRLVDSLIRLIRRVRGAVEA